MSVVNDDKRMIELYQQRIDGAVHEVFIGRRWRPKNLDTFLYSATYRIKPKSIEERLEEAANLYAGHRKDAFLEGAYWMREELAKSET